MNKSTSKDLLNFIVYVLVGVGVMLLLIHFLGEVHGLISTVVIFIGQTGLMFMRLGVVQRELRGVQPPSVQSVQ